MHGGGTNQRPRKPRLQQAVAVFHAARSFVPAALLIATLGILYASPADPIRLTLIAVPLFVSVLPDPVRLPITRWLRHSWGDTRRLQPVAESMLRPVRAKQQSRRSKARDERRFLLKEAAQESYSCSSVLLGASPVECGVVGRAIYLAKRREIDRANSASRSRLIATIAWSIALMGFFVATNGLLHETDATTVLNDDLQTAYGYGAGSVIAALIARGLWRGARTWRHDTPRPDRPIPIAFRAVGLAGLLALGWYGYRSLRQGAHAFTTSHARIAWEQAYFSGIAGAAAFAATFPLISRLTTLLASRREAFRPLDPALIEFGELVRAMALLAPSWDRPYVPRYLIHRLEGLARTVLAAPIQVRIPVTEPALRERSRSDVTQLAAVIRRHKAAIAAAHGRSDYDKILTSLSAGLIALSTDDWKAILANAPEARSSRRAISGWVVRNLFPAVLLAAGAAALPWLPPFRGSASSALGVRISLAVYAALRLIPGQQPLTDLFDKGMARGFGSSK